MNTAPGINAEDYHNLDHANYANAAADLLVLSFRLEFSVWNGNCFNPRFPRLFHDFLSGASGVKWKWRGNLNTKRPNGDLVRLMASNRNAMGV